MRPGNPQALDGRAAYGDGVAKLISVNLAVWIKRFTAAARPGAYLRVVAPGRLRAGDPVVVTDRPDHTVTVALTFRALTREPGLLPRLLEAPQLPAGVLELAGRRTAPFPG